MGCVIHYLCRVIKNEVGALWKIPRVFPFSFCHARTQGKEGCLGTRRQKLTRHGRWSGGLILSFSAFRIVRIKCWLFLSLSLLWQQIKTEIRTKKWVYKYTLTITNTKKCKSDWLKLRPEKFWGVWQSLSYHKQNFKGDSGNSSEREEDSCGESLSLREHMKVKWRWK